MIGSTVTTTTVIAGLTTTRHWRFRVSPGARARYDLFH
jgi:hypothetical protein